MSHRQGDVAKAPLATMSVANVPLAALESASHD
jgi:hypothetical protein